MYQNQLRNLDDRHIDTARVLVLYILCYDNNVGINTLKGFKHWNAKFSMYHCASKLCFICCYAVYIAIDMIINTDPVE